MICRHSTNVRLPVKAQEPETLLAQRLRDALEKHRRERQPEKQDC